MKLTNYINEKQQWIDKGYIIPSYDREKMIQTTKAAPVWVHFGSGNIFRSFFAPLQETLIEKSYADKGIVVVGRRVTEEIELAYNPFDALSILVTLKAKGDAEKQIVGSVAEALSIDDLSGADWERLLSIFENPSLQMVSFTITEKGYADRSDKGVMAQAAALCYHRFQHGALPLALVSQDNCSQNGQKLMDAILDVAGKWQTEGKISADFIAYLKDSKKIGFPWSMVDKITPRPDAKISASLTADGAEDMAPIITSTGTYTAAFVNAEEAQYWIVEDWFPAGRPSLEKAGVIFTDRDTVEKTEQMKVCTCLNPLHTALAVLGCILGYETIADEMKDEDLVNLIRHLGFVEGLPVVVNPGILSPEEFLTQVLEIRFPNPYIPDTPARIASDTSQKLSIRFGETIAAYMKKPEGTSVLRAIPVVLAGWLRYLTGLKDDGQVFEKSPDPRMDEVSAYVKNIKIGDKGPFYDALDPLLHDAGIFGVDLYDAGLAKPVHDIFSVMIGETGGVRKILKSFSTGK